MEPDLLQSAPVGEERLIDTQGVNTVEQELQSYQAQSADDVV